MCSACATMRLFSSKSAVEQSAALMFAENADRIRAAPISSATSASACPRKLELQYSRSCDPPDATIPSPTTQGDPARGAVELDGRRAGDGRERMAGSVRGGPARTSSAVLQPPAPAVSPDPHSRNAPREARGTGPRARLRAARSARMTGLGSADRLPLGRKGRRRLRERPHSLRRGLPPLVSHSKTKRGEHAGSLGTSTVVIPRPSARSRRGAGRRRTRRAPGREGRALLDGDHYPQCAQHLGVHDLQHVGGVEPLEGLPGCGAIELDAVGEPSGEPAEEKIRVGDGRLEPA